MFANQDHFRPQSDRMSGRGLTSRKTSFQVNSEFVREYVHGRFKKTKEETTLHNVLISLEREFKEKNVVHTLLPKTCIATDIITILPLILNTNQNIVLTPSSNVSEKLFEMFSKNRNTCYLFDENIIEQRKIMSAPGKYANRIRLNFEKKNMMFFSNVNAPACSKPDHIANVKYLEFVDRYLVIVQDSQIYEKSLLENIVRHWDRSDTKILFCSEAAPSETEHSKNNNSPIDAVDEMTLNDVLLTIQTHFKKGKVINMTLPKMYRETDVVNFLPFLLNTNVTVVFTPSSDVSKTLFDRFTKFGKSCYLLETNILKERQALAQPGLFAKEMYVGFSDQTVIFSNLNAPQCLKSSNITLRTKSEFDICLAVVHDSDMHDTFVLKKIVRAFDNTDTKIIFFQRKESERLNDSEFDKFSERYDVEAANDNDSEFQSVSPKTEKRVLSHGHTNSNCKRKKLHA